MISTVDFLLILIIYRNDQHRHKFSSPYVAHHRTSTTNFQQRTPQAFSTPTSPQQSTPYNTFAWPFSTSPNQKVFVNFSTLLFYYFVYSLADCTSFTYTDINTSYS